MKKGGKLSLRKRRLKELIGSVNYKDKDDFLKDAKEKGT
jgi:hypothetical protein